jgi:glutamate-5-semialdehyde dehydrogenase
MMKEKIIQTKLSSTNLLSLDEKTRKDVLHLLGDLLLTHKKEILEKNQIDLYQATINKLSPALMDRLKLDSSRVEQLAKSVHTIADFPQVVGNLIEKKTRPDGLIIQRQRIPLGVILMIFESRPNVLIDACALGIKSGNAMILKGGHEAYETNSFLFTLVQKAIKDQIPAESMLLLTERAQVLELLEYSNLIDLVIPRGGEKLVRLVKEKAKMPVMSHDRGLCHVYLHHDADPQFSLKIVLNAKASRPGVCNAMETLLVHHQFPQSKLKEIIQLLLSQNVTIHAEASALSLDSKLIAATAEDFNTEWLDKVMNLKIVKDENEAISHIKCYGSHHTEAIVAKDERVIEQFIQSLDASCLMINASTRFNDGGELGLGAELGISTSKFHAYGPVGAEAMTTIRTLITGQGHTR